MIERPKVGDLVLYRDALGDVWPATVKKADNDLVVDMMVQGPDNKTYYKKSVMFGNANQQWSRPEKP